MKKFLENIGRLDGTRIALQTADHLVSYKDLEKRVNQVAAWLQSKALSSIAVYAQNSIDWVLIDLACQSLDIVLTPIPLFFSQRQFDDVIQSAKVELVLSDTELPFEEIEIDESLQLIAYSVKQVSHIKAPANTSKITYTSGSTGSPKGVCLSIDNQLTVAQSLVDIIGITSPRHLCLLPLPTLLENIAGVYSPLIAKGTVIITNDEERGFKGSQLINPQRLLRCISLTKPNTLILVPELLQVLVQATEQGWLPPPSLQFIAVGGSKVSPKLIEQSRAAKLPVYQGYGLSECASVVSLCSKESSAESTGTILPHLKAKVEDEQLVIEGNTFLGYLEDPKSWGQSRVYTGDKAQLVDNELIISGRLKNILINSFGRNISPEWIESELLATKLFSQVVVIGDAKPFCCAILVPVLPNLSTTQIDAQITNVNKQLPDYAQVKATIMLSSPMTERDGLYTQNMRPKRSAIIKRFQEDITKVYSQITA